MGNYYFLGTLLPPITLGAEPEISWEEFIFLLKTNLTARDLAQVKQLRTYFDIENMRALWLGLALDKYGNLDERSLEEALLTGVGLPAYVYDFIVKYSSIEERIRHFPSLLVSFFRHAIAVSQGFLKDFFSSERNLRLVLAALRAKQLERDLLVEMQYENPDELLVAQILAQKDAKTYEPPVEYQELKTLFNKNPLEMHQALSEYRFKKWSDLLGLQTFTIDRILIYMYQLILVEKWMALEKQQGQMIINRLVQGVA